MAIQRHPSPWVSDTRSASPPNDPFGGSLTNGTRALFLFDTGTFNSDRDEDTARLKQVGATLLADAGVTGVSLPDDLVHEVVRFGASELHAVCAVVGGMAAQEAIKLITSQFVPLTGGLLYVETAPG